MGEEAVYLRDTDDFNLYESDPNSKYCWYYRTTRTKKEFCSKKKKHLSEVKCPCSRWRY